MNSKKYLLVSLMILAIVGACGGETSSNSEEPIFERINPDGGTWAVEDFKNISLKVSKEYDVSELEDASGVWFGFWTNTLNNSALLDYELRIYPSHQSALDNGVKFVEEVIGDDAILSSSLSSWEEGVQDRRVRSGRGMSGSESNTIRAKYLDYMVYGNTIILCTGLDLEDAQKNCTDLASSVSQ